MYIVAIQYTNCFEDLQL